MGEVHARRLRPASGDGDPGPGSVVLRALDSSYVVGPKEGREVTFGRNRPEVHVCVGEDDVGVSRCHGVLRYTGDRWWVHPLGRRGLRIGERRLLRADDEPVPLPVGHTFLVIDGTRGRRHVLEARVIEDAVIETAGGRRVGHREPTWEPERDSIELSHAERLAVVALAEEYLRDQQYPWPRSYRDVADLLTELDPERTTGPKKVEHLVTGVRRRLTASALPGLVADDGSASGDRLKHNLITLLLDRGVIRVTDLRLIELA